ncbi:MAG: glycosyltransferase family 4 protein [Bacteroidales bacterium]
MKILILSSKMPYPQKDGGAIAVYMLAKGLVKAGANVTMMAMNTRKHRVDPKSIPLEVTELLKLKPIEVKASANLLAALYNLIFSKESYISKRFYCKKFSRALKIILMQEKFDVIQLDGLYVTPYIPLIRRHTSAILSYRAHNIECMIWTRLASNLNLGIKRWYISILANRLKRMEQRLTNTYDILLPITSKDANWFASHGNTKSFEVTPAGFCVNEKFGDFSFSPKPFNIAFLGALDWAPNQEGLLWFINKVWPKVRSRLVSVKLHVAGRNAPQWLEDKITGKDGVHYHGEVDDANSFLLNYPVVVVPLLSGSGMRVKIVEAMLLGRIVISTSIGAEGIHANDGADLLLADNPESMANLIVDLSSKPTEAINISSNAYKFAVSNFDSDRIGENVYDFYNRTINANF